MTFTELMALDKEPDQTKPNLNQAEPKRLISNITTERPVRPERVERPARGVQPEQPVQTARLSASVERSHKRETKRHAFEFYRDQIASLKQLRLKVLKTGREVSMSAMVREALDDFIKKHQ